MERTTSPREAKSDFLLLTLLLLLLTGGLLVWSVDSSPVQASNHASCEEVTDVTLASAPEPAYADEPVLLTAEVLTGSLPVTYTWDFDDGTVTEALTTTAAIFTSTHPYTSTGTFSVTLTTWNTCTLTPLTTTIQITVEARPCISLTGLTLNYTPTQVYVDQEALFTAEVVTGSLPVTYTWSFGDGTLPVTGTTTTPSFTATHAFTAAQVYTVALSAWNACTITPLTTTIPIMVEARPCITPTGLTLAYTPTQIYAHQEAVFAGEIVTGAMPITYTWLFGDGTSPVTGTANTLNFSTTHTFTEAQAYTVTLSARNACAITPTQEAISLTVAPCEIITDVAATYWPTSTMEKRVITFTAEVSSTSPPWIFEWAFGDGQTAVGQVVTHVYTTLFTHTVTLTAENPCNHRTTTTTLHIRPLYRSFLPSTMRQVKPPGHLGYGANVASADHANYLAEMGFDWAKGFVTWSRSDVGPVYNFVNVDNQLREFLPHVPNVLLRIHGNSPPVSASDLAKFQAYCQALAAHVSTNWRAQGLKTIAYEIWNEPNLDYEWGGSPNAAQYTAVLKAGYQGIKAGDPQAIVVSAGLATTGGSLTDSPAELAQIVAQARQLYGAIQVTPDLTFLRNMYKNGAKGYFDALGTHPYGGSYAPDTPSNEVGIPIYFRRAEEQRQVMLDHGDDSPMWNTEFGWVLKTDCNLGEHEWMEVSEAKQAEYLAAAYAYADENWPWMGPMFLFNLDFGTVYWYDECDPMRWYSITYRENHTGNGPILTCQAFYALRDMPKKPGW
jgi:PKD repeat protein